MKPFLLVLFAATCSVFPAKGESVPANKAWPRPTIVPVPVATAGVKQPAVSLSGTWKINYTPPPEFWRDSVDPASWRDATVPPGGQRGFAKGGPTPDTQYAYKKRFTVPADFAGKRIILRFDSVVGDVKVWVNGVHLRDHFGGWSAWDCDITDRVAAGKEAWLTVGVTETTEGLAPWNRGGIDRDVKLLALLQDHVIRFNVETELDRAYRDAVLKVWLGMAFHQGSSGRMNLTLRDPQGTAVPLQPGTVEITRDGPETILEIPVRSPLKWDAEHPNLYTLDARLVAGGEVLQTLSRKIGFRQVEQSGRQLLVNGKEVKLRGVNWPHVRGDYEQAAKELWAANMNHIRVHVPSEEFIEACDRYGVYITAEAPVCFAVNGVQNNPLYLPHYINNWTEMIEIDRSHPSVIMWSTGNESSWGRNVARMADYVRMEDPRRPVLFTYSDTVPLDREQPIGVAGFHYVYYDDVDFAGWSDMVWTEVSGSPAIKRFSAAAKSQVLRNIPVLHDEMANMTVSTRDEKKRDPNVHNFWGETIKGLWERMFQLAGCLGGDFFGRPMGNGRELPEFWHAKKAYSPVRIEDKPLANPGAGKPLEIPVKNWFDHTNLNELKTVWTIGKESGTAASSNVESHGVGTLRLAPRNWQNGDVVNLKFYRQGDLLVDEYNLPISPSPRALAPPQGPAPDVREEPGRIVFSGADFSLAFSRQTGLISEGSYKGTAVVESGPYLHLGGLNLLAWSLKSIVVRRDTSEAVAEISGSYGPVEVSFEVRVDGHGLITTKYKLGSMPLAPPMPLRRGWDVGGYEEVGISFVVSSQVDRLAWRRRGLWSAYPDDHIGRNAGTAYREGKGGSGAGRADLSLPWSQEERDPSLFGQYDIGGRGTNDFRSMKENIFYASAVVAGTETRLRAESDGTHAVRLEVLDDLRLMIDDRDPRVKLVGSWSRVDDNARTYNGTDSYSSKIGDYAELVFEGTGVCWLGTRDTFTGLADVYVDNKLEAPGIDLTGRGVGNQEVGGATRPREMLFSKQGLPYGPHTIKIVAAGGNDASGGAVVSVDAFKILDGRTKGDVRFIINNEWNYPEIGWRIWGVHAKDAIAIGSGYTNEVRLRFADHDDAN